MQHFWIRILKKWCSSIECIEASSQQSIDKTNAIEWKQPNRETNTTTITPTFALLQIFKEKRTSYHTVGQTGKFNIAQFVQIATSMWLLCNLIGLCFFEEIRIHSSQITMEKETKRVYEIIVLSVCFLCVCRKCPQTIVRLLDNDFLFNLPEPKQKCKQFRWLAEIELIQPNVYISCQFRCWIRSLHPYIHHRWYTSSQSTNWRHNNQIKTNGFASANENTSSESKNEK